VGWTGVGSKVVAGIRLKCKSRTCVGARRALATLTQRNAATGPRNAGESCKYRDPPLFISRTNQSGIMARLRRYITANSASDVNSRKDK